MEERIVLVSFFLLFIVKKKQVAPARRARLKQEKQPVRKFPNTDMVYHFHPIGFVNQMRLMFPQSKADTNYEAMVRAFLRVIKEFEGVPGEQGYTTLFGKKDFFSDMSTHPEKPIYWYTKKDGTKVHSTAAGSYQIMKETWWDYNGHVVKDHKKAGRNENRNFVKKYGIKDFSPKSQDEFCIALLIHAKPPKGKQKGLIDDLLNGYITRAIESYASFTWASFTPGRYENQGPTKGITDKQKKRDAIHEARMKQLKLYDKFLAEELAGQSDLHLEPGFLKRFGIKELEPQELIENKKKGLDLNKVLIGLNKRAAAVELPIGKCAKYVRLALEDGGMSTNGRPNAAADYVSFLPKKGFKEVQVFDDNYQKGDIAVFERFQGVKKYHKYGHIQIYNGEKWVSDFFQTDFWAGNDYRVKEPNYKIYRWE
ncbi:putative enzyme [Tenacibaculum maritimum]|uniref:glycoside hydrolase family 24 protein n=1 Tax=Tenacibaculum maritimum TaxID=107401 RepID=UPI0012E69920|nr:glycoside hydrolase family 104 protein [Tenacibaculum maritimum]CAA0145416.1 putative enzyme [Tenacibaculum maritimum]